MKSGPSHARQRKGVALVLVLAMLVMITVIAVTFFARTVSLRKATRNEKTAVSAKQLADSVINLVQAQIDHAATRGTDKAWASQPGAIRLFNANGDLQAIYRLYSASALTTGSVADLAADMPPANWASSPAIWVDLNQPVDIADPAGKRVTRFPILDPNDPLKPGSIQTTAGFEIRNAPGASASQPAPMPVRWLYVLADGKFVSPTASGTTITVSGATKGNPIIGRVAYWTDDDTCRVNINTAGGSEAAKLPEGIFWDTPRFNSMVDRNFGDKGPASGEFQRYPGHPATTTLGLVFPSLTSKQLLELTPRYRFGGSEDAEIRPPGPIKAKADRLYSSVGELAFDASRAQGFLSTEQIESARFFLTATSRSPELNLFGQPRVSIWPVSNNTTPVFQTATDRLLSFASSMGASRNPYYFTRSAPLHATADITKPRNNVLLNYLDRITGQQIPGFGGNFAAKYPQDRRDILTKIFDYIRTTNLKDPGLSTAAQFASGGFVSPARHSTWNTMGFGRFPLLVEASIWLVPLGQGSKTAPPAAAIPFDPAQVGTRLDQSNTSKWVNATTPAANRVAVQAYLLLNFFDPSQGWSAISDNKLVVEVTGLNGLSLTSSSEGSIPLGMPATGTVRPVGNVANINSARSWGGTLSFRSLLLNGTTASKILGPSTALTTPSNGPFPFYSNILSLPSDGTLSLASSNTVKVRLYANDANGAATEYTLDLASLLNKTMPTPKLTGTFFNSVGLNPNPVPPPTNLNSGKDGARSQMAYLAARPHSLGTFLAGDVLWSVIPAPALQGDYRLLSRPSVNDFAAHPAVADNVNLAFTLMNDGGFPYAGGTLGGKLVKDAGYFPGENTSSATLMSNMPVLPPGINGVSGSGDWDNAFGVVMDGPYVNKADEGKPVTGANNPYFDPNLWAASNNIGSGLFSPNRMMPSAVMFGSLPTGVISKKPWTTLLFRPGPAAHSTADDPPDHLLLDLFWMPVAEPYAISEPFSTAGKVNMNYQIQPFTYIERSTALQSVLATEMVAKVKFSDARDYKRYVPTVGAAAMATASRVPLNLSKTNGTLRQFEEKFAAGKVFKSASEICEIFLVPEGSSWSSDAEARSGWYGNDFAMVGDNTRERPYASLYPRLTTKSNTYTVYFTVQVLRPPPLTPDNTWVETTGAVLGEFRGSTTIERYIDQNEAIPDFATNGAGNLEDYYNWRISQSSQFAP